MDGRSVSNSSLEATKSFRNLIAIPFRVIRPIGVQEETKNATHFTLEIMATSEKR